MSLNETVRQKSEEAKRAGQREEKTCCRSSSAISRPPKLPLRAFSCKQAGIFVACPTVLEQKILSDEFVLPKKLS